MKRACLFLTEAQFLRIYEVMDTTGLKFAEIVRRALDSYLDAHVPPHPEESARRRHLLDLRE